MKRSEIPYARLLRQRIAGEGLKTAAEVVRWMGAVQAQDYAAAKWAVGLRSVACTEAEIEAAFSAGAILRTHVMRPTWHFVAPEDILWMQMLTAPRVNALAAYQYRRLELDAGVFKHTNAVLAKALRGGKELTRPELGSALEKAGMPASGLRLTHIAMRAELDAVICSGARRGKQFTYALVDERAPNAKELKRDEALALLTERYFTSHGPATTRDFAWWSGLPSADVKEGLEMVKPKLVSEEVEGQIYWLTASAPRPRHSSKAAHLLANFDEYIVGYTDRAAIFDEVHAQRLDTRHNPLFNNTIVSNGLIVGTWTRRVGKGVLSIAATPFAETSKSEALAISQAGKRLAKFMEMDMGK